MADMKKIVGRLMLTTVAMGAAGLQADTLHMVNGQKQTGIIVQQKTDASRVTIRTTSGEISVPRSKISRVEEASVASSYGQLGDEFLNASNYEKAIENYEAGLALEPGNLDLKQKLQEARGGVNAQSAQVQAATDDKARRGIEQARRLANAGDFELAFNTLKSFEPTDTNPLYPEFTRTLVEINLLWGEKLLDRQDTGGAAAKLTEVLKLDPANARAKQLLVRTFEGDPTKLEQSAQFYLQSEVPEEQLKGAEALYKMQRYSEAVPVFAKYAADAALDRQFSIKQRLATGLDILHQQAASQGNYPAALQYFNSYLSVKPDADQTPYSKYMFMIKRTETDMNNPASRFELASFAEQLGLVPTAKEEYRNILGMDAQSTSALTALRKFADSDMADAREFMNSGQYTLAANMAQGVVTQYPMYPDLIAQANQLQAQAQVEAQRIGQAKKAEARALAERGDNYYNQAMSYSTAYGSTELSDSVRIFSPRNEAAKYLGQAIFAWKTALQIDPELGDPTSYNLTFKIQDATNKYSAIANRRAPRIPRVLR